MSEKRDYDVFLSYSAKDRDWVSQFAVALEKAGVHPWFDVSQLRLGELWREKMEEALRDSRTLVVILTPNSVDNPWMFFEVGAAVADKKRIIPILTQNLDFKNVPPLLLQFQALREDSPQEAGKKLAAVLTESVET